MQVTVLQQTCEALLAAIAVGERELDPPPTYATCLHVAYYLEQVDDMIPVLARLPELVAGDGLVLLIIEGPGQLQDLK